MTMLWGVFMIGKRGTWEKEGATLTFAQAVVGGIVALAVIVGILVALVVMATR